MSVSVLSCVIGLFTPPSWCRCSPSWVKYWAQAARGGVGSGRRLGPVCPLG